MTDIRRTWNPKCHVLHPTPKISDNERSDNEKKDEHRVARRVNGSGTMVSMAREWTNKVRPGMVLSVEWPVLRDDQAPGDSVQSITLGGRPRIRIDNTSLCISILLQTT